MSSRIPAWKRLGLKLKYAKDDPDSAELLRFQRSKQEQQVTGDSKSNGLDVKSRPTKRRRLNGDVSSQVQYSPSFMNGYARNDPSRQTNQKTSSSDIIAADLPVNGRATHKPAVKKGKRVSFSQDVDLGESDLPSNETTALGISSSVATAVNGAERDGTVAASSRSANNTSKLGEGIDSSEPGEALHQLNPKAKASKKRKAQTSASGTKPTAALDYLSQHHKHRDSWKFNKNRDVWILNHAQDVEAIPRSQDLALAGYVHGLPEQAASRNRLLSECKTNLKSVTIELSNTEKAERKQALMGILGKSEPSTETDESLKTIQELPRSLLLLWALGASDTLAAPKPRTNRKSRTAATIDVSTSEEDDSSSSGSESSDNSDAEKIIRKAEGIKERLERDTGSSSSSSSDDDTSSSDLDEGTSSDSE